MTPSTTGAERLVREVSRLAKRLPCPARVEPVSPVEILLVVVAVVVGAMVQASAGIGITLVAAPVLLAVDPAFVPLPLILGGTVVGVRNLVMEFPGFDARRWRRCLLGAPAGLLLGEVALANLSERGLILAVGLLLLVSVVVFCCWCMSCVLLLVSVGIFEKY